MSAKILTVSMIGALAVAVAPAARADGNTQEYLDAIHAAGIVTTAGSDSFLVLDAVRQCQAMDHGVPPAEIADYLSQTHPDFGIDLSATIVFLSIKYFCPAHMPPLPPAAEPPEQLS